jgi:hypothetical protein
MGPPSLFACYIEKAAQENPRTARLNVILDSYS